MWKGLCEREIGAERWEGVTPEDLAFSPATPSFLFLILSRHLPESH